MKRSLEMPVTDIRTDRQTYRRMNRTKFIGPCQPCQGSNNQEAKLSVFLTTCIYTYIDRYIDTHTHTHTHTQTHTHTHTQL